MLALHKKIPVQLHPEQVFMLSGLLVNAGNYFYNLLLGRYLGPEQFADAAVLITFLLVLSFVAMTFQLAVAKFTLELDLSKRISFIRLAYKYALSIGLISGAAIVLFANELQQLLNTNSKWMFVIFGCAVPIYFILSVNRGRYQGNSQYVALSGTYQFEMLTRLIVTFIVIAMIQINPSIAVALGIAISMIAGLLPFKKVNRSVDNTELLSPKDQKKILTFFLLTAFYEGTLIVCNNSDILLVKHYFDHLDAGLYASLALIGRVVYFVTWMFVMLLLPKVIERRKKGENTTPVLFRYLSYILLMCSAVVVFTFVFPELSVRMLFGDAYLPVAPLLGWYALATALFAISNIFAYYFLSMDRFLPILFAALMGILQIVLIALYHSSLFEVVLMQIIAMGSLLVLQLIYFFKTSVKVDQMLQL